MLRPALPALFSAVWPAWLLVALAPLAAAQQDLSGNHRLSGRPFWGGAAEVPIELLLEKRPGDAWKVTHTYAPPSGPRVVLSGVGRLTGDVLSVDLTQLQGATGTLGVLLAEGGDAAPHAFKGRWQFKADGTISGALGWTASGVQKESPEQGHKATAPGPALPQPPPGGGVHALLSPQDGAELIPDRARFEELSRRDNVPGAMGVREVKILITGVDGPSPKLHFIDTNRYSYHYDFARQALHMNLTLQQFNAQTYFTQSRKNIAGSIIAHDRYQPPNGGEQGIYTVEFWPTDPVRVNHVALAYRLVKAGMPFAASKLWYHPASETQNRLYLDEKPQFVQRQIPVIATEDLFRDVTWSPLNPGEGFGLLRVMEGANARPPSVRDVVIFRVLPNDLTHVAGVITEVPQTPLSHVNLKAKQNDTPNAYVRNASTDPRIQPLLGKLVRYAVGPDGYELREATQAEVDAFLESKRPATGQSPPRDLSVTEVQPLEQVGNVNTDSVGAKAANVGELRKIFPPGVSPDGYAIPFALYDRFMSVNGLYQAAREMMADADFKADPAIREQRLAAFRRRLRDAPVPADVRQKLDALRARFPADAAIRCRSSTNNEDLPGFNGAGLYDSYTHRPDEGRLERTVKQVWASLWNYRAFEEREFYRVDHLTTAMGVLVHQNFDDELANGVAVTKNIYDPNWEGYYVNVQVGESLVTNPDPGATPDELLVAKTGPNGEWETQFIQRSSLLPAGKSAVLTADQLGLLRYRMARVQWHFKRVYKKENDPNFAMDIEFKLDSNGRIVIKQARPWVD